MPPKTGTRSRPKPIAPATTGGFIGMERDGVVGWARDIAHPDVPVRVRLMAGDRLLAEAVADRFEDARVRTLAGPGIGGFLVPRLDAAPAAPFELSLHDATGARLGVPLTVCPSDLARMTGAVPRAAEGHIDGVFDGKLMGWARDTADPAAALELELLDTGRAIAATTANRLREDLRAAGLHHGLYGYSFDLPVSLLDGRAHSLTVRIAGTDTLLLGGPITFGPLEASALLAQLSALQSEVATLRLQVNSLMAPDGQLPRTIMRILAERLAAQAEIAQDQTARDLEALRIMVFAAAERAAGPAPEHYAPPPRRRRA